MSAHKEVARPVPTRWEEPRDPDGPPQFALRQWIDTAPFEELCGLEIVEAAEGASLLRMPFKVKLAQGAGILHGGAVTTLADTALAMAIKSLLPPHSHFVTAELTLKFHAPVRKGMVTGRGKVLKREGKYLDAVAEVFDEEEKKVATLSAPFIVLREGPPAEKPEG